MKMVMASEARRGIAELTDTGCAGASFVMSAIPTVEKENKNIPEDMVDCKVELLLFALSMSCLLQC